MSNLADTSLAAFRELDVTAGQQRNLSAFRPGLQITRQELVKLTGMPINAVSGRCTELLQSGILESMPAVGKRHPLRLKNSGTTSARGAQQPSKLKIAEFDSPGPLQKFEPMTQEILFARDGKLEYVALVQPYIPGRMSQTVEQARAILSHPLVKEIPADVVAESRRVMAEGVHWVSS